MHDLLALAPVVAELAFVVVAPSLDPYMRQEGLAGSVVIVALVRSIVVAYTRWEVPQTVPMAVR